MGKAVKSLTKLLVGAFALGFGGCQPIQDYSFNLNGLEDWQKPLFIQAGEYWQVQTRENPHSKNKAYLGNLDNSYTEYETTIKFEVCDLTSCGTLEKYRVIFNDSVNWGDCSKPEDNVLVNFLQTSRHGWGHVLGYRHSTNPKDIMYPYAHFCGEYPTPK